MRSGRLKTADWKLRNWFSPSRLRSFQSGNWRWWIAVQSKVLKGTISVTESPLSTL